MRKPIDAEQRQLFDGILEDIRPLVNLALAQPHGRPRELRGIADGGSIINSLIDGNEVANAFSHLVYLVTETEIEISPLTFDQIAELGGLLTFGQEAWESTNPTPPNGAWEMSFRTHPELFRSLAPHWLYRDRRARVHCGFGWAEIVADCHHELLKVQPEYRVNMIKQKWAGLQYLGGARDEEIRKISDAALARSVRTCEWCGDPGNLRELDLDYILCDPCNDAVIETDGLRGRILGPG